MNKHFSQHIIDEAAKQRVGNAIWNDMATDLNKQGYKTNSGGYIHGLPLCVAVITDPNYLHLRQGRLFGGGRRILIEDTLKASGVPDNLIATIMRKLP